MVERHRAIGNAGAVRCSPVSDEAPAVEYLDDPPELTLVEAMLSYQCNLKGCCCVGWRIPFKPGDLVRLAEHLPPERHSEALADGLIIVTDEDHRSIDHIRWEGVGEEDACRFLEQEGGCGVHREHGLAALPDLCVEFPAFPFVLGDRFEVHHQGICPEVIEAMARTSAPFAVTTVPAPPPDHLIDRLKRGSSRLGRQLVYGRDLGEDEGWQAIHGIRDRIAAACAFEDRPALDTLAAICDGLAEIEAGGDWRSFEPAAPGAQERVDRERFLGFLVQALSTFEAPLVSSFFWKGRRFMLDHVDPATSRSDWDGLEAALRDWGAPVQRRLEPAEPTLRPLLLKFMGHRYFQAPTTACADLRESLGVVPLVVALALRVTAAVAECRGRVADVRDLKIGLTTAEYTYRNSRYPPSALPWFGPAQGCTLSP